MGLFKNPFRRKPKISKSSPSRTTDLTNESLEQYAAAKVENIRRSNQASYEPNTTENGCANGDCDECHCND